MKTRNKALVLTLCAVLLVVATVMGTLAYLTDTTDEVKNTFTIGKVDIDLTETKQPDDSGNRNFKMVPGCTIEKDPKVTVTADSEDCLVFVKVEKSANFTTFLTYDMADGWTALPNNDGVYYREVKNTDTNREFPILKDNKVQVKSDVISTQMNNLTANTYPTLTFKAYACQLTKDGNANFTPADAWNELNPTPAP